MTTICPTPTPVGPSSAGTPPLRFARTVDRDLVHRDALGEVFLTDTRVIGGDRYLAAAQLPRSHAHYGDHLLRPSMYDPMLLLEVSRQATLAAAHLYFGVPPEFKFIITDHRIRLSRPGLLFVRSVPGELTADVVLTDRRERQGQVTGLDHQLTLSVGGIEVGQAALGMRYKSPESYLRLRAANRDGAVPASSATCSPPGSGVQVAPSAVGRLDQANVVLHELRDTPSGATAVLRLPTDNPSMFDHPQDHLPGMVLTEAARQLAIATVTEHFHLAPAKTFLTDVSAVFTQFGELDVPTELEATVGTWRPDTPGVGVDVVVTQNGRSITELRTTVGTVSRPRDVGGAR